MRHRQALCAVLLLSAAVPAHAALKISNSPTRNVSCASGICSATAQNAVLNVSDLAAMLAVGDAIIKSGAVARDVEIDAALNWASTGRLTLDSFHAIAFNRPIVVAGAGALTITTNDGGANGDFRFFGKGHVEFGNIANDLVVNGQHYRLANSIKQIIALRSPRRQGPSFIALGKSFDASGKAYNSSPVSWYWGIFEGLGNAISNLTVSDSKHACVGLFGCAHNLTPTARDIGLLNVNIHGSAVTLQSVGALAGYAHGDIVGAYATGQVSGTGDRSSVGGLVGAGISNVIRYSHSSVAVSGSGQNTAVGSLAGSLVGSCVGGTCSGLLDESYATGTVTGGDTTLAGGLVGFNVASVITDCYATGSASTGSNGFAGGLIGFSQDNDGEESIAIVVNSYSTGSVQGGSGSGLGGFVGFDEAGGNRANLYWDMDTSGITNPGQGAGFPANDSGITGLTTAQLLSALPAGFSANYWAQGAGVNGGYPYLIANPPPQ